MELNWDLNIIAHVERGLLLLTSIALLCVLLRISKQLSIVVKTLYEVSGRFSVNRLNDNVNQHDVLELNDVMMPKDVQLSEILSYHESEVRLEIDSSVKI